MYLDYLLRRFSAIPEMWWSMANDYDLCAAKTMEDWYAIEDFIVANDPYGHLLSNHNCFGFYDFKRPHITHQCVQTILVEKSGEWQKEIGNPWFMTSAATREICPDLGETSPVLRWSTASGRQWPPALTLPTARCSSLTTRCSGGPRAAC